VRSAAEVNTAIQDCVALLQVPRACLGITCASRGSVAGRLQLKEDNAWSDLAASARGHAIPGDMAWVASAVLRSDAAYILVVEKDAVFNRLLQERACERLGAVMITARGQPDLASRAFLARLSALLPHAPVLALVDWNPSGVLILATYRVGSLRMGLEAGRYRRACALAGGAPRRPRTPPGRRPPAPHATVSLQCLAHCVCRVADSRLSTL
jgi:meiotic recombination protein SPO11